MKAGWFQNLFSESDSRTKKVRQNILVSIILKGISVIISFLIVPLTLGYLNSYEYGVWLTLSSILIWINYFDIGLANGLRNKLAEALSVNDVKLGQIYVSTTFALLTAIMLLVFVLFAICNIAIDWNALLKVNTISKEALTNLIVVVFAFFCLQFIFKFVGVVLLATQQSALNDLLNVASNFLSLIIIFILTKITKGSLAHVAITFSLTPVLVFIISYFVLFYGKYKYLRPSVKSIQFTYSKDLIGLGLQFFIIQIAVSVVIYSSTNIIVTQLFGNESVTVYNIAYKYFYSLSMVYIIIMIPFWSASTEAYAKKDLLWIKSSLRKLVIAFAFSVLVLILMLLFSDPFYKIWIGDEIKIPFSLSMTVALYVLLFNWSNTFIYIVNGIGTIRLQLYVTSAVALIYIPAAIYMGNRFGINGVVLATCFSLIPTSILIPIQCVKLYSAKATGIWGK